MLGHRCVLGLLTLILQGCSVFSDDVGGDCADCDPGAVVEGSGGRLTEPSTEFPWAPLIDACMTDGRTRTQCIDALPPEILAELEAWEARNAALRREQLQRRLSGGQAVQ